MTTNIGSHIIQDNFEKLNEMNQEEILENTKNQVFELLRKSVRPEFLNRIDETIMFRPLSREDVRKIVDIQFKQIQHRLKEGGITIDASDEVLDYLAKVGFDPQFGARPLKRVMQKLILNELSKEILAGNVKAEGVVSISMGDKNGIVFENLENVNIG